MSIGKVNISMRRVKKGNVFQSPGWSTANREQLASWIRAGAGQHLPVVFDFDNTIVCGDIGEATLAWLAREGKLPPDCLPADLCPPLILPDGSKVTLASIADVTEYYEAFLAPSNHGAKDPAPFANGYVWAVEIMQGLKLAEVVRATREVMELSQPGRECFVEPTPGKSAYPIPFFYPEIVELIAVLIRQRFDVWVVSASNVWSVRCAVLHGLNPLLKAQGVRAGLPLDRVIGVSTLLTDRRGGLYKDTVLMRDNPDYLALKEPALKPFRLTRLLQYPVPTYSGKVGAIWDYLGRRPYLCAGDSPGDHAMLSFSEHRLWIARLEKPDYQQVTRKLIRHTGASDWIIQRVLARKAPGFLSDAAQLHERLPELSPKVRQSLRILG